MANYITYNYRIHGNTGRKPAIALTHDDLSRVIAFIKNYAEVHAILLPSRIPGLKDYEKTKLLPCNTSKRQLYLEYAESCKAMSIRACAETTFLELWRCYLPYIRRGKPMTDLCITCKENSAHIIRSSNLSTKRLTEVSECMYIYSLTCIIGNTKSNRAQKSCRQREELL